MLPCLLSESIMPEAGKKIEEKMVKMFRVYPNY